ncbi:MAG: DNA-directed DNA polymerase [Methanobacteriaceae archaeon]|nr:DNA-directed DNA polymerase [Methanobacteriaceae archaeon]
METKKFTLLDIDYITEDERPVVRLFGNIRGESKNKSIIALDRKFKPYIYVIPENKNDFNDCIMDLRELDIESIETVQKVDVKKKIQVLKVFFKHPQDVPKLRDKIWDLKSVEEIREHDIPFYRRYLIDNGLFPMDDVEVKGKTIEKSLENSSRSPHILTFEIEDKPLHLEPSDSKLNIMSFDIEVRNPEGMPQADRDEIIMISLASNFGLKKVLSTKESTFDYVETLKTEKEMINRFVEIVNSYNPDLIVGYNSDNFDFPYINERANKLGVSLDLGIDGSKLKFMRRGFANAAFMRGRIHVDLYLLMRRYIRLDRYTLERVYKELFGEEKKDIEGDILWKYWDAEGEKLQKLFEYSMDDAVAAYKISEKILPLNMELTRIVGQPFFDIARMATGQQVEWFLIRKAFEYNDLIPNKPSQREHSRRKSERAVGGYVKEPEKGLHENIVYFDFRSLYPSIIISKNVSPDTLINSEIGENSSDYHTAPEVGFKFLKKPVGFVPSIIGKVLEERTKIKNLMKQSQDPLEQRVLDVQQEALKRLANSIYGVYGFSRFRWYSIECADAITAWGRDYIKKTMEKAELFGFHAIYADTDGFYAVYKQTQT